LLFHSHVPLSHWVDAFSTTLFTINWLPLPVLGNLSPYEFLSGKPPTYADFHPFSCRVFSYLLDYASHKFVPSSTACIFLGYNMSHKGFRCLDPSTQRIYITYHARFDELNFSIVRPSSSCDPTSLDILILSELVVPFLPSESRQSSPSLSIALSLSSCVPYATNFSGDFMQPSSSGSTATIDSTTESISSPATASSSFVVSLPSDQPVIPSATSSNRHPMIPRAKAGVFKPKHHP